MDPGNTAKSATCPNDNGVVPHSTASEKSAVLDRASKDKAKMLLLESRSNGVIWDPYLLSICRRRFLCQVAAGEKVDGDGGGIVTSLFCSS